MNKKTPRASRAKKPLSASKRINVYPTTIKGRFRINIGPFAIDSHAWLGADENAPDVIRSLGNQKLVRRREEPKQTRNPLIKDPYAITRMASDWLDVLFELAETGDIDAARLVAVTVKWNTQRLNVMAHARPELFRAAARECDQWPVLMSRHPALCEDHEALLGKLTLGYDLPYYFDGTSKWTKDAFGKIANSLLEYVWQGWAMKRDGRFDINTVTPDAITLPEFRDGPNAKNWWSVAKAAFLHAYPKPEEWPEFADLVKSASHRKNPGRLRARILERIRQRFLSFAKP